MSTNGKGDKSRVRDMKRFRENFDKINWRSGNSKWFVDFLNKEAQKFPRIKKIKIATLFGKEPWSEEDLKHP